MPTDDNQQQLPPEKRIEQGFKDGYLDAKKERDDFDGVNRGCNSCILYLVALLAFLYICKLLVDLFK